MRARVGVVRWVIMMCDSVRDSHVFDQAPVVDNYGS